MADAKQEMKRHSWNEIESKQHSLILSGRVYAVDPAAKRFGMALPGSVILYHELPASQHWRVLELGKSRQITCCCAFDRKPESQRRVSG